MVPEVPAPRFAPGQRVRVIANQGGLYAAQIGVVGVIAKQRQKRRYGYRSYDVSYQNERGQERIVIVREDDLEAVEAASESSEELTPPPAQPVKSEKPAKTQKAQTFALGERVTVDDHLKGADESPETAARWAAVGIIIGKERSKNKGLIYAVRYPDDRVERIHGDHLRAAPPQPQPEQPVDATTYPKQAGPCADCGCEVGGLNHVHHDHRCHTCNKPICGCHAAHWDTNECVACRQAAKKASTPPKAPEKPPLFSKGDHVTVDPHSALAYETFTRKGAVGHIMHVGKPVCGIRRYQVLFEVPHLGGRRAGHIREEHLVLAESKAESKADAPAPAPKPQPEPEPEPRPATATPAVTRRVDPAYQRQLEAAKAGDAHEFALEEVLRYVVRGDSLESLRDHHGGGMGPCYAYEWQGDRFTVTAIGPGSFDETRCDQRFSVKKLYAEARARIAGAPQQTSLWESEVSA